MPKGPTRNGFRQCALLGSISSAFAIGACVPSGDSPFTITKVTRDAGRLGETGSSPIDRDATSDHRIPPPLAIDYCGQFGIPDGPQVTALGDDVSWAKSFGGWSRVSDIALGPTDDIVVVGDTLEKFEIDGHVIDPPLGAHGYIAKLSRSGSYVWSELFTGELDPRLRVTALPNGSTVASLVFRYQLTVAGQVFDAPIGAAIAAFDADGKLSWVRVFHTAEFGTTATPPALDVASDSSGNVYVAGALAPGTDPALGDGGTSVAQSILKLSPDGGLLWNERLGATGTHSLRSIGVDSLGNVVVAGVFSDTVTIAGTTLQSRGFDNQTLFLAKLDATGALVWARTVDGRYSAWGPRLAVGPSGALALAGGFAGQMTFDGGVIDGGSFYHYVFALGLDAQGTVERSTSIWAPLPPNGPLTASDAYAVALGPGGLLSFGGEFVGKALVGGTVFDSGYVRDAFLATLDASGAYRSSALYQTGAVSYISGLAYGSHGELAVAGSFDCAIELPLGTLWGRVSGNSGFVMVLPGQ